MHEVENTIASFAAALDEGANAVEVDVSVTRDRRGVIWHDWDPNAIRSLARAFGLEPGLPHKPVIPFGRHRKRTSALTLREFLEHHGYARKRWGASRLDVRVPTLHELFEWGARESRLAGVFLDLKMPKDEIHILPELLAEIDTLVMRTKPGFRVVLETAEVAVLAELRRLGSRYATCFDVEPRPGIVLDPAAHSAVQKAIELGAHLACPQRPRPVTVRPFATHSRIVARDLVLQRLHNAVSPRVPLEGVVSFTINDEREMSTLIRLGVAGIQSDRPRLLRTVAERLGKIARWRPLLGVPRSRQGEDDEQALRGRR